MPRLGIEDVQLLSKCQQIQIRELLTVRPEFPIKVLAVGNELFQLVLHIHNVASIHVSYKDIVAHWLYYLLLSPIIGLGRTLVFARVVILFLTRKANDGSLYPLLFSGVYAAFTRLYHPPFDSPTIRRTTPRRSHLYQEGPPCRRM
jgi:hypothetical protein